MNLTDGLIQILVLTMLPEGGVNSSNSVLPMGWNVVLADECSTE